MFAGEGMALLRPLTTPDVSVRESPPGFPSANTDWPTLSPLDVPTCDLAGNFCQTGFTTWISLPHLWEHLLQPLQGTGPCYASSSQMQGTRKQRLRHGCQG